MVSLSQDPPLPPLRQELRLEPASSDDAGAPRWRLYDPLQHRFYLLGGDDVTLLSLWHHGTVGGLRQALAARRQAWDNDAFEGLVKFLADHHLLQARGRQAYQRLAEQAERLRGHGLRGLVGRLLGFRLPMWAPHSLLRYCLPMLQAIGGRTVVSVWAVFTLLGLYLTSRQWDEFIGTFSNFFSVQGVVAYACALAGLKVLHELGHAYMAMTRGVRVGKMGVSIFMGVPMLFTELGDVARLNDPRARMWVAAGGVIAETFVAGLATLAWAVFPEGTLRSIAFVLATSSWTTSLFINLNPLSRFDGYYFLSDALKIDNLQPRALAWNQWLLGRCLLGPVEEPPEALSPGRAVFFTVYGTLVWCYQITLSCTIAWFTYKQLFELAGLALLGYALWNFVGRRLLRVGAHWWKLRERVAQRRRTGLWLLGGALLGLLLLPLDRHVSVPAMLGWQQEVPIQAPEDARIEEVHLQPGAAVSKGQLLARFYSPELDSKRAEAQLNLVIASERLDRIGGDAKDRAESIVLRQQQLQAQADLKGLAERAAMLEWRAPEDGVLADVPANLQAGMWVRPATTLGRVLIGASQDASGFVNEKDISRLQAGAEGVFIADEPSLPKRRVRLARLEHQASEFISPDSLSSRYGGPIDAQEDKEHRSVPVSAQHRVSFEVLGSAPEGAAQQIRGQIQLAATPQSLAEQSLSRLWHLLIAELRD